MASSLGRVIALLSGSTASAGRIHDIGLLVLRLWAGGVMALAHGIPKFGKLGDDPIQFADPLGLGPTLSLICTVLTELVGGLLIAFGFLTRAAVISLVFTFLVVVFIVKFDQGFKEMELGASFLIMYVVLLLTGPGRYSVDHALLKKAHLGE